MFWKVANVHVFRKNKALSVWYPAEIKGSAEFMAFVAKHSQILAQAITSRRNIYFRNNIRSAGFRWCALQGRGPNLNGEAHALHGKDPKFTSWYLQLWLKSSLVWKPREPWPVSRDNPELDICRVWLSIRQPPMFQCHSWIMPKRS